MGNFITYGVTEMLDNDQKFIIDSDRTGPGSITAKDAASSLLSKWAGFETFEEAVQNTISNNQEFIDRDTAIREETAELKKKIVTTFPAKEASGAVATFESEFEDAPLKSCIVQIEPVQDLHGYDSPWPAGGGKNLLPPVTYNLGITSSSVVEYSYTRSKYCKIEKAGTYTISRNIVEGNRFGLSATVEEPKSGVSVTNIKYHSTEKDVLTYTFEFPEGYNYLLVYLSNESVAITGNYQVEEGSTATAYEPYENSCPITGWTGCELQRTGKNIINMSKPSYDGTGINKYYEEFTVNSGSIKRFTLIAGQTYTFSYDLHSSVYPCIASIGCGNGRYSMDIKTTEIFADGHVSITFTPTETDLTGGPYLAIRPIRYRQSTTYDWSIENIQLELGSTATAYEPYQGETYPITFPSEAGTVYGGYVDVVNGELVVDRAIVDLGTLNWSTTSNNRAFINDFTTAYGCALSQNAYNVAGCIAEQYKEVPASGSLTIGTFAILQVKALYFYYDGTNLPTGKMVFPLAEPIHYPLTPIEIKTLLGQNNIWANTGDVSVEYLMSDVGWYVEKKLRAFQSILTGVEDSAVASKNYSTDSYLIFNNDIYRVTKAITAGETIEEGVNVTKTTVAEQLLALAQA